MEGMMDILFRDDANERGAGKLVKDKLLYQLKEIDGFYTLTPFPGIVISGYISSYQIDNKLSLCYVVDETDVELRDKCAGLIYRHDIHENNEPTKIYSNKPKVRVH